MALLEQKGDGLRLYGLREKQMLSYNVKFCPCDIGGRTKSAPGSKGVRAHEGGCDDMKRKNLRSLLRLSLLTTIFALALVCLGNAMGEEPVSGAPDKPEVAPAAPEEPTPAPAPEKKAEEGVVVAPPAKEEVKPAPAAESEEGVILGVPVQGPPVATIIEGLPPLKGPKKSVAVMDFENNSGFAGEWSLGEGMADMLTTALVQTNRFIVVERPKIKKILAEQDLAASGRAAKAEAAKIGKLMPAQIGVAGAVTEFSFEKQKTGIGFEYKHVAIGFTTGAAHVAINLRMFDTTTGQILFSDRVERNASYTGIEAEYTNKSLAIGGEHFQKTPLGKATQEAINDAVIKIAMGMERVPWKGSIVLVQGDKITINCGQRDGIVPGQRFIVYSKGEELTDPETGEILGAEEARAGEISVVEVKDRYSIAQTVEGKGFKRGDVLRLY